MQHFFIHLNLWCLSAGINSRTNTMYQLYALAGITWFALFSNPASATYNINS
jgi:hypothetical protein